MAPKTTIKMMIGANHNFLRERRNDQSSFKNDTVDRSKLIFKSFSRRVFVGSIDPVRGGRFTFESQLVSSE